VGRIKRKGESGDRGKSDGEKMRLRETRAEEERSAMEQRRTGGFHIARMRVQFHMRWLCVCGSLSLFVVRRGAAAPAASVSQGR